MDSRTNKAGLASMLRAGVCVLSRRRHLTVLVKQGHIFLLGRLEGWSGQQWSRPQEVLARDDSTRQRRGDVLQDQQVVLPVVVGGGAVEVTGLWLR